MTKIVTFLFLIGCTPAEQTKCINGQTYIRLGEIWAAVQASECISVEEIGYDQR